MHVVIVGGGFAGIKSALELSKDKKFNITLISDQDYFLHHATLYATATGRSTKESVIKLSEIFAGRHNVEIIKDEITKFNPAKKTVGGKHRDYEYDMLILALGVVTTYFNIDGLEQHCYGIKTLPEVQRFKEHIYDDLVVDGEIDRNYVVVGAGPTGVELAAAMKTYLDEVAAKYAHKKVNVSVSLVEASPRVLPLMPEAASKKVASQLRNLGVKVMTGQKVESQTNDAIIANGKKIPTHTVVWTSGVTNHPFFKKHKKYFEFAPNGRVLVDEHMRALGHVYVIGDNAATKYCGVALTALRDAKFIARHFKRILHSKELKPHNPLRKPIVTVPVGEKWAIIQGRNWRITGRLGAWIRRVAELYNYCNFLPLPKAWRAWREYHVREEL